MEALIGVEALIGRPGEISTRRCRQLRSFMHRLMIQKHHSNVRVVPTQATGDSSFVCVEARPQAPTPNTSFRKRMLRWDGWWGTGQKTMSTTVNLCLLRHLTTLQATLQRAYDDPSRDERGVGVRFTRLIKPFASNKLHI